MGTILKNELRIGNYLNWIGMALEARIMHGEDFKRVYDSLITKENVFKPIPLTEEWLLRVGFEKDGVRLGCKEYKTNDLNVYKMIGDYPHFAHGVIDDIRLKYVHQLQNLYFALTNKELTLKQ